MAVTKPPKAIYSCSQSAVIKKARVFHGQLTEELAHFTPRFPWLTQPWLDDLLAQINATDKHPSDRSLLLEGKVHKGDLETAMENGMKALHTLNYRASLAFPNDHERQRAFGQETWRAASKVPARLRKALRIASEVAADPEFNTELVTAGMTPAEFAALTTTKDVIKTARTKQALHKGDRGVSGSERITKFNALWVKLQTIRKCAQIVWADDKERRRAYGLSGRVE